jgi:phosphohistidine phosphatase
MKTLLLLRHAKSSWNDESLEDHERPLNQRGKKEAPKMGRVLLENHLLPDLILSSDAKRCRRTVEKVAEAAGYRGETMLTGELYLATPIRYLQLLSKLSPQISSVLVVGHNPGMEEFAENLTGRYEPFTTAALAHIRLPDLEHWTSLDSTTRGELVQIWQPMEVS